MTPQLTLFDLAPEPTGPCPLEIPDLARRPTVLLDLNYTLVANSPLKRRQRGMSYQDKILTETYRTWLVELLKPYQVILWTVRFARYRAVTLRRIEALLGWQPDVALFNPRRSYDEARPPQVKEDHLLTAVIPVYGSPAERPYLALESNAQTRTVLARYGIPAIRVGPEDCWTRLPGHDLPPFEREQAEEQ